MFGLFSNKAVKDIQSVLWGNFTVNKTNIVQNIEIGDEPELLYLNIHYPIDNKTIRHATLHPDANQTKTLLDLTVWIEKNNFSIIDENGVYHNATVQLVKDSYKINLHYGSYFIDMIVKMNPTMVFITIADTDSKQLVDTVLLPVQKEPTFMQKNGNIIMMVVMIGTQMFSTFYTSKQMRKQVEAQKEAEAKKKAEAAKKKEEEKAEEEEANGEEEAEEGANGEEEAGEANEAEEDAKEGEEEQKAE